MATRKELKAIREKTSQALIEAALILCDQEGYASLTLRSVARKAGIAPTSFYRHFRDIEELGVAMVDQARDVLDNCLSKVEKTLVPLDLDMQAIPADLVRSVKAWVGPLVHIFVDCAHQNRQLVQLFFQESTGSSEEMHEAISGVYDALVEKMAKNLFRFEPEKEDRDEVCFEKVKSITKGIMALLKENILEMLSDRKEEKGDTEDQITAMIEFFILGVYFQKMIK